MKELYKHIFATLEVEKEKGSICVLLLHLRAQNGDVSSQQETFIFLWQEDVLSYLLVEVRRPKVNHLSLANLSKGCLELT